jgi:hypothetical protein
MDGEVTALGGELPTAREVKQGMMSGVAGGEGEVGMSIRREVV